MGIEMLGLKVSYSLTGAEFLISVLKAGKSISVKIADVVVLSVQVCFCLIKWIIQLQC